ncbi:cell division control protein 48 homolog C-like isoform X2 [Raphanus sativus]|uniref:Cell division control protein 48 homolog C-like isoform X2 n=1 Tax=Raphanus sativus TaxID=3726 RepID=A0A6J0MQT8_RAPSA|nr:cell division control protein 48 homolog C-like isoform X2 [Raphanus sativus]
MGRRGVGGRNIMRGLSRAMESCGKDLSTAEEIVGDLRSRYGNYARMSRQTLVRNVRNVLNAGDNNKKRVKEDDEEDDECAGAGKMKKQRRLDEKEDKEKSVSSYSSSSEYGDLTSDSLRGSYAKMNNNNNSTKLAPPLPPPLSGNNNNNKVVVGPTFKDFAGIKKVLHELDRYILTPLLNPPLFGTVGANPPSGILFHGPPGCGKTMLANAVANEAGVPFYQISATEVVSGVPGESEENIRELFSKAYRTAPSIVFIDEIDAIGSKRENQQRGTEKRIVTQLLTCMDGPPPGEDSSGYVLVIGATNMPDALDPALRRGRRFGREIALTAPDVHARAEILSLVAQRLRLEGSFDMKRIARLTPGFVGADLEELADMAASLCINRIMDSRKLQLSPDDDDDDRSWLRQPWSDEELDKLFVRMSDFEEAVKLVKGSLTREGFSTVPDVTWGDVGGIDHLRTQLKDYVVNPIKYPETFEKFGGKLNLETGFLLYGPPGCGKTLVAKAVANEAGANFIHIKGPELLNKYVGESERAIRTLFQRARQSSPCVIFFDEVDALTTNRGSGRGREGDLAVGGLLNQFLIELHGGDRRDVYVIGATNRIDVIDPAFLRPGRFTNRVYVPLPNADDRVSILKSIAKKRPIDPSVDLDAIANKYCEGFSGADLANLMDKAIHVAVKEKFQSIESSEDGDMNSSDCTIKFTHFKQALSLVTPSLSKQQIKHYEEQRKKYQSSTNMDQINVGPSFIDEKVLVLAATNTCYALE